MFCELPMVSPLLSLLDSLNYDCSELILISPDKFIDHSPIEIALERWHGPYTCRLSHLL